MSTDFNNSLMQAFASGNGNPMSALIPQVLAAQLGEDNPTVDLLNRYFAQQAEKSIRESSVDENEHQELLKDAAELERAQTRLAEMREAMRDLRDKIEKVYAELETLRQRNDLLAWAVGACSLCWGEDLKCPVCWGEGHSGFFEPDRQLFMQLVAPALRQFQSQKNADRPVRHDNKS